MPLKPILLLTRPMDACQRFAQQVEDALPGQFDILMSPLLQIDVNPAPAAFHEGVKPVFTSLNGVSAWAAWGGKTQDTAFCVGPATSDAATALGFDAINAGGTVDHLVSYLTRNAITGTLLHVRGEHTRGDFVDRLTRAGKHAIDVVAYSQNLQLLSPEAKDALEGAAPVIVPLFSPRSAKQFVNECPVGTKPEMIGLSAAVAAVCGARKIATTPTAEGMIGALRNLAETWRVS